MSITYNPQGKITLEPTKGNVLGITEIVLQHFERTLKHLEKSNASLSPEALRQLARDTLEQNIEEVTERVLESCRNAMMSRPEDALRRDLVGRILFHRLEDKLTNDMENANGFPRAFTSPVLKTVRAIIGDTHYNNLNEHSARPSLEYCVVHELGESRISWEDFYSQNLVSILLVRIKNLVNRWMHAEPGRKRLFMETVNAHLEKSEWSFGDKDFQMLMETWGVADPGDV